MKSKKILRFLLLGDALSSRNLTAIGLVVLLMGVYAASGGRIKFVSIKPGKGDFGGASRITGDVLDKESQEAKYEPQEQLDLGPAPIEEEILAPPASNKPKHSAAQLDSMRERLRSMKSQSK